MLFLSSVNLASSQTMKVTYLTKKCQKHAFLTLNELKWKYTNTIVQQNTLNQRIHNATLL